MERNSRVKTKWYYIKKNWQLYLFFLLPAVALTFIFKYIPMGGVLIAFKDYNAFKGIWGSDWVGIKYFETFYFISGFPPVFDEYSEAQFIRPPVGIPDSRFAGSGFKQNEAGRDQEKNSTADLSAEFYFSHRARWYGENLFITGRTDQLAVWNEQRLHVNA